MNRQMTTAESEADDELLTSFLDQELSPEERSQVERRLVDEENLRKRLAEMRRAWELLDELPETRLNQHFTKSTMEMVTLDLEKNRESSISLLKNRLPWLPKISKSILLIAASVFAMLVGAIAGLALRNRSLENEAIQLAIAGSLPILQEFPDVDKLESLMSIPRWRDLLGIPALRDYMIPSPPEKEDLKSIKEWAGRLDIHHKEIVYNQQQTLERMSPADSATMKKRYRTLRSQPNAEELQQAASAMNAVLQSLSSSQSASIRSLPKDRKITAIRQEVCYYLAMKHGEKLTGEERSHIDEWARNEMFPQLRESTFIPFPLSENALEEILYWKVLSPAAASNLNASNLNLDAVSDLDGLMDSFLEGLTPDTKGLFQGVMPNLQFTVIATWILQRRPEIAKEQSIEELYELYKNLPLDRKEQIDMQLPKDAIQDIQSSDRQKRRGKGPGRSSGGPVNPGSGKNGGGLNGGGQIRPPLNSGNDRNNGNERGSLYTPPGQPKPK